MTSGGRCPGGAVPSVIDLIAGIGGGRAGQGAWRGPPAAGSALDFTMDQAQSVSLIETILLPCGDPG